MLGQRPPPVDRVLDTRLWKHYLAAASLAGVNNLPAAVRRTTDTPDHRNSRPYRYFTREELKTPRRAFVKGASTFCVSIVKWRRRRGCGGSNSSVCAVVSKNIVPGQSATENRFRLQWPQRWNRNYNFRLKIHSNCKKVKATIRPRLSKLPLTA